MVPFTTSTTADAGTTILCGCPGIVPLTVLVLTTPLVGTQPVTTEYLVAVS